MTLYGASSIKECMEVLNSYVENVSANHASPELRSQAECAADLLSSALNPPQLNRVIFLGQSRQNRLGNTPNIIV